MAPERACLTPRKVVEGLVLQLLQRRVKVNYLVAKEQKEEGPEAVKPGTITLPMLPEPMDTAPIDLADWLTVIEPAMTDQVTPQDNGGSWWLVKLANGTTSTYSSDHYRGQRSPASRQQS